MTPTPIRQVLSTFQKSGVRTLLMGGQACVFYGAAQVSKDIDFLVLAEPENFLRLQEALAELQAERIAVPPFDAEVRAEQARDRDYWEPLRRELEQFRREHRNR